ncbi:kinesin KP1, partial [Tanacetum coccineum]
WSVEFEMVEIFKDKKIGLLDTKDPSIPVEVKSFSETLELLKKVWPIKNEILKDDNGAERGLCELAIEELFDLMKPDRDYITLLDFKLKGEAANGETIHGCLQMVDLAGSKKLDVPTGESNFIRSGLLFLDMVIEALSTNQQHIPYNNHTLTRSLEASLEGKSKVVVLAHVSGLEKFFNETMNTLRFANVVIETLDKDLTRNSCRL